MRDLPPCLNRRYTALNELIKELNNSSSCQDSEVEYHHDNDEDPGLKLMCQFWDILKNEPDLNLPQAVGDILRSHSGRLTNMQCMSCFTPAKHSCYSDKKKEYLNKNRSRTSEEDKKCSCSHNRVPEVKKSSFSRIRSQSDDKRSCCSRHKTPETDSRSTCSRNRSPSEDKISSRPKAPEVDNRSSCSRTRAPEGDKRSCCSHGSKPISYDNLPLSKVLCNLNKAASFDKECNYKINQLLDAQKELKDQIQHLEKREKDGVCLLKEADGMWITMEAAYKKKLTESTERQKALTKELNEVEASSKKWRKNKKDLEFQMTGIIKAHEDIKQKINQKINDAKYMEMESDSFKQRIENNKMTTENARKSLTNKRQASNARMANIATELKKLQNLISEEAKHKYAKEQEGNKYIKEARDDLRKLCRVLLQKKLENEDLRAEKDAIILEIDLLKRTCEECNDKCQNRQVSLDEEIKKVETDIAEFKIKCIRCHQCTDTCDIRKFCSDCPRCQIERDCLYLDDHCCPDTSMDCVCMSIKQKFLDNVFDNMYTVLERQIKTNPGKAVGDAVLKCLQRSRNGKLNEDTRKILQDFILTTVKKNLNLTIVGGAVKTRCEMDSDTYKELMVCLKDVKSIHIPKADKGTAAKKDPCRRWGGTSECNCPKGPKACICAKKAPLPPTDRTPCPEDKEDAAMLGVVVTCPHKESTSCGPDCAMHAVPSCVGTDVAEWRPDPCGEKNCFTKNMRAVQCVLGPESLSSIPKPLKTTAPLIPDIPILDNLITCDCGKIPVKPCKCPNDRRSGPRNKIIEEVMGRYIDVSPIQKVSYAVLSDESIPKKSNPKPLKPKIAQRCYNGTCTRVCEQVVNDIQSDEMELYTQGVENKYVDVKPALNVDKEIHSKVEKDMTTRFNLQDIITENEKSTQYNADTQTKRNKNKVNGKIKILIDKESIVITEFVNTPSGTLVIELDGKITELIERKTAQRLNLPVSFNKSESDKYSFIVNFNPKENDSGEIKTISIKKSPSGSSSLEIHNDLFNLLKSKHNAKKNNIGEDFHFKFDKVLNKDADDFSGENSLKTCRCSENAIDINKNILLQKDFQKPKKVDKNCKKLPETCSCSETAIDTNKYKLLKKDLKKPKEVNEVDISEICSCSETFIDGNKYILLKKDFYKLKEADKDGKEISEICSCSEIGLDVNKYILCKKDFKKPKEVDKGVKEISEICSCSEIVLDVNKYILLKKDFNKPKEVDKDGKNKSEVCSCSDIDLDVNKFILCKKDFYKPKEAAKDGKEISEICSCSEIGLDVNKYILCKKDFKKPKEVDKGGKEISEICSCSEIVLDVNNYILLKKDFNKPKEVDKDGKNKSEVCSCSDIDLDVNKFILCKKDFYKPKEAAKDGKEISEICSCSEIGLDVNKYILCKKDFKKPKEVDKSGKEISEICSCSEIVLDVNNYILLKKDSNKPKEVDKGGKEISEICSCSEIGLDVNKYILCKKDFKKPKEVDKGGKEISEICSSSEIALDLRKSRDLEIKSNSDSHMYEKDKTNLHDIIDDYSKPSAFLKNTESGQYATVLNKESKKIFVDNIKNYLRRNSHRLSPTKITESGEIIIVLNEKDDTTGRHGSLKITRSGNFYLIANEKFMKGMTTGKETTVSGKKNTTMCNAHPDQDSLCEASKCVCHELQHQNYWKIDSPKDNGSAKILDEDKIKRNTFIYKTRGSDECAGNCYSKIIDIVKPIKHKSINISCNANPDSYYDDASKCVCYEWPPDNLKEKKQKREKITKPDKCITCSTKNRKVRENSPHIVIKSCPCPHGMKQKYKRFLQCNYFTEPVCPFHKGRYDTVYNKVLEISRSCNKDQGESPVVDVVSQHNKQINSSDSRWDSLNFLPPQLPPFLQNVKYR